jgi:response regulator of citrate/malate metabolism
MGKRHAENQGMQASQDQRIDSLESQQQAAAPPAAPSGGISEASIQRLQELGKLHDQGVLTDEEFAQQKDRVLAG